MSVKCHGGPLDGKRFTASVEGTSVRLTSDPVEWSKVPSAGKTLAQIGVDVTERQGSSAPNIIIQTPTTGLFMGASFSLTHFTHGPALNVLVPNVATSTSKISRVNVADGCY